MGTLSSKQENFCQEYALDRNATRAAVRAGYSKKTAHSSGPRLLENVGVKARIIELTKEKSQKTGIDAAWLLNEAADLYRECREEGDRGVAKGTLDMIGKHIDVQAFKERVEHDHTLALADELDELVAKYTGK